MGSNSSSYGQASRTITQIHTNWEAGQFIYDSAGCVIGAQSFLAPYTGYQSPRNYYTVTYTGYKKSAGNYYNPRSGERVFLGVFDGDQALFAAMDAYVGYPFIRYLNSGEPNTSFPPYGIYNGRNFFDEKLQGFSYDIVSITQTNLSFTSTGDTVSAVKPCYLDLVNGYYLDTKTFAEIKPIVPTESKEIIIGYYRKNPYESIGIPSIDWMHYRVQLVKGVPAVLPIISPVLGGLYISDTVVKSQLNALPTIANHHPFRDYFPESVPSIFNEWNSLYQIAMSQPLAVGAGTLLGTTSTTETSNFCLLAATNNYWDNGTVVSNIGFDANHPMFAVDNERAYNWHIKPQSDGSFGDLVMNSPLLIDIGKALDVGTWSVNLDDPDLPRVDNLGWRIARTNEVLGIRVKPNGEIDPDKDKKLVRQVIQKDKRLEPKDIGVVSFGKLGMVVKRITNRFKRKGKNNEIVSDQCVIVQDIPQLMQEYFEQFNLALGIQESSAIEIKQGEKGETVAKFSSQLELLIELVTLMSSANEMTRAALVSSLVTQSQTSELIAGLGLPSVTKTIPIEIDKKVTQLPFKGIAAHRSISQEIATCTYNVGIATGQLL